MKRELVPAVRMLLVFTLLTGVLYPAAIMAIGNAAFPEQAQGSLIRVHGRVIGSNLIGQRFEADSYFHPRPSNAGAGYAADASGGSNLAPTSTILIGNYDSRARVLSRENLGQTVPVDLVTTSGSGLDPHITPAAAYFQAPRLARARGVPEREIRRLIERSIEPRTWELLGEERVNVLLLNLALDGVAMTDSTGYGP